MVIPQILTVGRAEKLSDGGGAVRLPQKVLADEDRVETGALHPRGITRRADPALGDPDDAFGDGPREPLGRPEVDRERLQIAIVHADERRARGESGLQLPFVVDLDEGITPEGLDRDDEGAELFRRQQRREQEHRVGACCDPLESLARIDDEMLHENGEARRARGRADPFGATRRRSRARRRPRSPRLPRARTRMRWRRHPDSRR